MLGPYAEFDAFSDQKIEELYQQFLAKYGQEPPWVKRREAFRRRYAQIEYILAGRQEDNLKDPQAP